MATEITVKEADLLDEHNHLIEKAEMDFVLAYKNLLAAEDHLREVMQNIEKGEYFELDELLDQIEDIRSNLMPPEVDSRFHCIVKHLATASIALDELAKAFHTDTSESGDSVKYALYSERGRRVLTKALEKLWGHEIESCKRCK